LPGEVPAWLMTRAELSEIEPILERMEHEHRAVMGL
jgi:hypothetical protein